MKSIYLLLSILMVVGCASGKPVDRIEVKSLIFPVHPVPVKERRMNYLKEYVFSFIDSDGNQYVTEWLDPSSTEYDHERFDLAIKQCSAIVGLYYPKILNDSLVLDPPLEYKKVVQCFLSSGYKLIATNSYRPEMIVVDLSKTYSRYGDSVTAGGRVEIDSTGQVMKDILPKARKCFLISKDTYSEGGAGDFIFVDMKPLIDVFESCLIDEKLKLNRNVSKN